MGSGSSPVLRWRWLLRRQRPWNQHGWVRSRVWQDQAAHRALQHRARFCAQLPAASEMCKVLFVFTCKWSDSRRMRSWSSVASRAWGAILHWTHLGCSLLPCSAEVEALPSLGVDQLERPAGRRLHDLGRSCRRAAAAAAASRWLAGPRLQLLPRLHGRRVLRLPLLVAAAPTATAAGRPLQARLLR